MIALKSCPNCKSYNIAQFRVIPEGFLQVVITKGVKINAQIITSYCVCQDCHLIFQNPRLSDEELDIYYSSGYYRKTINQPPEGSDKGEENRAKIDYEIIRKYVGNVKSHLDIGCGLGYLLKVVDADFKVGVESDKKYVKFKDIKVFRDLKKVSPKKFDLVTSLHSLEHVPYPQDYLKGMTKFIKKGGFLVIEVPSWKTRGGPLGFAHLSYFEPDVLRLMCRKAELRIVQTEFTPHLLLICQPE